MPYVGLGVGLGLAAGPALSGWNGSSIYGIGDSFMSLTGGTPAYGVGLVDRLAGDFAGYTTLYDAFPGEGSASIRDSYLGMPLQKRRAVLFLVSGRNSVLADPTGTRTQIQQTVDGCLADGKFVVSEIPLKVAETVGADFDTIVAYHAWLAATYPGRVVSAQNLAQLFPSGDGALVTNAGYDVWAINGSNVMRSAGLVPLGLPITLTTRSCDIGAASRYMDLTAGTAQPDNLTDGSEEAQTWAVWYKSPSGSGTGYLWGRSHQSVAADRLCVRVNGGQVYAFGGSTFANAAYTLDTGWHLYAMRIRNSSGWKVSVWVDGTQRGSEVACTALGTLRQIRMAEASTGGSFQAQGLYCDPCRWSVDLSNAEMLAMYTGGRKAAASLPQAASLCSFIDFSRFKQGAIPRGVPDRCGVLDAQAVNWGTGQLSTDVP